MWKRWKIKVLGNRKMVTRSKNYICAPGFVDPLFFFFPSFVVPGMTTAMSRRRVSCRDLSRPECDGWLWKKRKDSGVFIAQKWQRFWFVLTGPSLYWYTSQQVGMQLWGYWMSPEPNKWSTIMAYHPFCQFVGNLNISFAPSNVLLFS